MERKASEKYLNDTIRKSWKTHKIARPFFLRKIPDLGSPEIVDPDLKKHGGPDYFFSPGWSWIECIQGENRIPFTAISPKQRGRLETDGGFVYLVIGPGQAPKGKRAFLVPWSDWKYCEVQAGEFKSFAWPGPGIRAPSIDMLRGTELRWEDGYFHIPPEHRYWALWAKYLKQVIEGLERVTEKAWPTQVQPG